MAPFEHAARRLAAKLSGSPYDDLDTAIQVNIEESFGVAMVALRRPSEAMIDAGRTVVLPNEHQLTDLELMLIWERMLDAALTE